MSPHPPGGGRPQLRCGLCPELVELRVKVMGVWLCLTCAAEVIELDGVPKIDETQGEVGG